jgi:hypothetical protein
MRRSLGAVLLLASPAAPSLPSADALYLKTFETHKASDCVLRRATIVAVSCCFVT